MPSAPGTARQRAARLLIDLLWLRPETWGEDWEEIWDALYDIAETNVGGHA